MDFSKEDFKASSLRFLDKADAIIVIDSGINVPMWEEVSRGLWDSKKQFVVKPPYYVTMDIAEFVKMRLSSVLGSGSVVSCRVARMPGSEPADRPCALSSSIPLARSSCFCISASCSRALASPAGSTISS